MKSHVGALAAPLALMTFLPPLAAQAQDRETRDLSGFASVAVGGGIDLFLRQGQDFRVEVAASDGKLGEIVTEVVDGRLDIRRRRPSAFLDWGDPGTVSITLPALESLTASGGSDVKAEGTFSSEGLELVASGGSDLSIDVAVTDLHVTASGGSDMSLSGSAKSASVESSGGSDLNASRLAVDEASVQSSGGSDVALGGVRTKLVANASGGSDVRYSGDPGSVQVNSSGGSSIDKR